MRISDWSSDVCSSDLFENAALKLDYADIARRLTEHACTYERYRTAYEAAQDQALVDDNPLFGPSPANPSGFAYPATRSFANMPGRAAGDPLPAPFLGEHSEEVLAEVLRSEEHTSELQSIMRISYAVF